MKLPITSWTTALRSLGYRVNWKAVLQMSHQQRSPRKGQRKNRRKDQDLQFGPLEPRQLLAAAPQLGMIPNMIVDEGRLFTMVVFYTDPDVNDTHTVAIDWGDGHSENLTPASGTIQLSHTYADNGFFSPVLTITDSSSLGDQASFGVVVNDLAPQVLVSSSSITFDERTLYTVEFSAFDPGADTISQWEVNWGDGSPWESLPANASTASHVYQAEGYFVVQVRATNEDGTHPASRLLLDNRFGNRGVVTTDLTGVTGERAVASVEQPDGKLLVAGHGSINGSQDFVLLRYLADGTLDNSFGNAGVASANFSSGNDVASRVAIEPLPGGEFRILVGGTSNGQFAIAGFNQNGVLDTSFGTEGKVVTDLAGTNETLRALVVQSDGKLIAAGSVYIDEHHRTDFALVRYNMDGTLDTSFGSGGFVTTDFENGNDEAWDAVIVGDRLVVVGQSDGKIALAKYSLSTGQLDIDGKVLTALQSEATVRSVAVHADGRLMVGGSLQNQFMLVRYHPDMSFDSSFGSNGVVVTDLSYSSSTIHSLKIDAQGKMVVAGRVAIRGSMDQLVIARLKTDGVLDNSFGNQGKVVLPSAGSSFANDLVLTSDGGIIAVGGTSVTGSINLILAKFLSRNFVTVNDLDPSIALNSAARFVKDRTFSGVVAKIRNWDSTIELLDASVTIHWGDGETSQGQLVDRGAGRVDVLGEHDYRIFGEYTIEVTVTASEMDSLEVAQQVTIWSRAPIPFTSEQSLGERVFADLQFEALGISRTSYLLTTSEQILLEPGIQFDLYEFREVYRSAVDSSKYIFLRLGTQKFFHTGPDAGTFSSLIPEAQVIYGDIEGDSDIERLMDRYPGIGGASHPELDNDGVFVTSDISIRAFIFPPLNDQPKRIQVRQLKLANHASFQDFVATIDWGDGTALAARKMSLGVFHEGEEEPHHRRVIILGDHEYVSFDDEIARISLASPFPLRDNEGEYLYGLEHLGKVELINANKIVLSVNHKVANTPTWEGNAGSNEIPFVVSRWGLTDGTTTVNWNVRASASSHSASEDDFVGEIFPSGTITFGPGEVHKTIIIPVLGDSVVEPDESFEVVLSNPADSNGTQVQLDSEIAEGTIFDDDLHGGHGIPRLSFLTETVTGHEGSQFQATNWSFTVLRTGDLSSVTTAIWSVLGATSSSHPTWQPANEADFAAIGSNQFMQQATVFPNGIVTFGVGQSEATILVPVFGDRTVEGPLGSIEAFSVQIHASTVNPAAYIVEGGPALGAIIEDDWCDIVYDEYGNIISGCGSGGGPGDPEEPGGPGNPGEPEEPEGPVEEYCYWDEAQQRWVGLCGPQEPAGFNMGVPGGATPEAVPEGVVVIDPQPLTPASQMIWLAGRTSLLVNPPIEGNVGNSHGETFFIRRSGPSNSTTTVTWAVSEFLGPAAASADDFKDGVYPSGSVTFLPGEIEKSIQVWYQGDLFAEPHERYHIALTSAGTTGSLSINTDPVTGWILNDDGAAPTSDVGLKISHGFDGYSTFEGQDGFSEIPFVVTRTGWKTGTTTVQWSAASVSSPYTAEASDFADGVFPGGVVTFAPGEVHKTVMVRFKGDRFAEVNEPFMVTLTNPTDSLWSSVSLDVPSAWGMIENDDFVSSSRLSIVADQSALPEGTGETPTEFTFTVSRRGNTDGTTVVDFAATGSGDEPANYGDFVSEEFPRGTLVFGPGIRTQTLTIHVRGDIYYEPDEKFLVTLFNPRNLQGGPVQLTQPSASSVILNDDPVSSINGSPVFTSVNKVDAYVGSQYRYESTATDPDGDKLRFRVGSVIWPEGYVPAPGEEIYFQYVNDGIDQRGIYTWRPSAKLSGKTVIVEEVVRDPYNEPVKRRFEIYVHPSTENSAPIITSQPATDYQLPLDIEDYENPDEHVYPDYVNVRLANGEEVKINVSIDPAGLGAPTADIVFAIDATGSMDGSIDWLFTETGGQSVVEQVEDKLLGLGFTENRYGLVLFQDVSQIDEGRLAVALRDIRDIDISTTGFPRSESSDHLWGNVQELKFAISRIAANGFDEIGHAAISRILDPGPPSPVPVLPGHHPYVFRGNATTNIILMTDDEVTHYSHSVAQEIAAALSGNPELSTDDIVLTMIMPSRLTGDNQNGNANRFSMESPRWSVNATDLVYTPAVSGSAPEISVFSIPYYLEDKIDGYLYTPGWFENWSVKADLKIHDLGPQFGQNARLVFGPDTLSVVDGIATHPASYWYLEGDARTDRWIIGGPDGKIYHFGLHAGAAWPDIKTGESISIELRMIAFYEEGEPNEGSNLDPEPRFDLFINGIAVGSQVLSNYNYNTSWGGYGEGSTDTQYDSIAYFGFGSHNSALSVDQLAIYTFINRPTNIAPHSATPLDFSDPTVVQAAKLTFYNNFGTEDGTSYDKTIMGMDVGGNAYRLASNAHGYERLDNSGIAWAYGYSQAHYMPIVEAVHGSIWNLHLLAGPVENRQAFASAFTDSFARRNLLRGVFLTSESPAFKDAKPFFDPDHPTHASFQVTLKGHGSADAFELNFVRVEDEHTVIGSIPAFVHYRYSHDFEATDYENDVPFTFEFDPDFVDVHGNVMTHGAHLIHSGRANMFSDRLVWDPPQVTQPTDFQFRVIVRDSAGQIGRKDWTVTVTPSHPTNHPPVVNVIGLAVDTDNNDGVANERILPAAQDLRGYRYQVMASDSDPQDAGNLRYYLVPTRLNDGTTKPVPRWLQIDRNTGLLTGRPGTGDVGKNHVTVMISDGRLYRDGDEVLAGKSTQTFALTVNPRSSINAPPVVESIYDVAIKAEEVFSYPVIATDMNNDDLSFRVIAGPAGLVIDSKTGVLFWQPAEAQAGQFYPVTISVSDGQASANQSFRIFVGSSINSAPVITAELPDWDQVSYLDRDYQQPLTATDADGDLVLFSVLRAPAGMTIGSVADDHRLHLKWSRALITAGRHRIDLRAFDGAGGVTEKTYYFNVNVVGDQSAPLFLSETPEDWRTPDPNHPSTEPPKVYETKVTLTSKTVITNWANHFSIDHNSMNYEIRFGTIVQTHVQSGDYYEYEIPIQWSPQYAGKHKLTLTATNGYGTLRRELVFDVRPFVTPAENRAPVFPNRVLGPFEKDSWVYLPLDVVDPDGHDFDLEIVSGFTPGPLPGKMLVFKPDTSGIYHITLRATDALNASSMKTYAVAITENSTPAILYAHQGQANLGQNYSFGFQAVDPNPNDTITLTLNQAAIDAGVVLVEQTPTPEDPNNYRIQWSSEAIGDWTATHPLPASLPIEIEIEDNHGSSSNVRFNLPVRDPEQDVTLNQPYHFRISAARPWEQPFHVNNPGGHELVYSFVSGSPLPDGIVMSTDGLMQWTPSLDLLRYEVNNAPAYHDQQEFSFLVRVNYGTGEFPEIPMTITVVHPSVFNPYVPAVDTNLTPPPSGATVGQPLVYQPVLLPPDPEHQNETVIWSLETAPTGMEVDAETGRVSWTPGPEMLGRNIDVRLRASSQRAGTNLSFVLQINAVNIPPLFATTFPTVWEIDTPLSLPTRGADPEGHHLSYVLLTTDGQPVSGETISIDNQTGLIEWDEPTTGLHQYRVRVYERFNPSSYADRALTLYGVDPAIDGHINFEPLILGAPTNPFVTTGSTFSYQFGVFDPDQTSGHVFELDQTSSATIDATGKFTWTPVAADAGLRTFRLKVTDQSPVEGVANNVRYLTFRLEAIHNNLPEIISATDFTAYVGTAFVHKVKAFDPDGDALTYSLTGTVPSGMTIHATTGEIRWNIPNAMGNGQKQVTVVVKDRWGGTAEKMLTIDVSTEDHVAPTITFFLKDANGNTIPPAQELLASQVEEYDLWIEIQDNRGIYLPNGQNGSWIVKVNNTGGDEVSFGISSEDYFGSSGGSGPRHGLWKVDLVNGMNQGLLEINIEAYDQAGNTSTRYARYYVKDPATFTIGKILNLNQQSAPITDRFEVIGNANFFDENRGGRGVYDLKLISLNDPDDFVYLARNRTAITTDSLIGVIDATQLPTGQYRLYLEVRCALDCIVAVDERIIEVQNEVRLGNLDLSMSDLDVVLGGVPIPLIRTYSSGLVGELDENGKGGFKSDFSAGWNLNFLQSRITFAHPSGVTTDINHAMADGTRVLVALPDGSVHRFSFDPVSLGNGLYLPYLNPDPEFNSQLYLRDVDPDLRFVLNQERGDGTYRDANSNRDSIASSFGTAFILETENGLKYVFDIRTGELIAIEDSNDARIKIERFFDENEDLHKIVISAEGTGAINQAGQPVSKSIVIRQQVVPGSSPDKPQYRIVSIEDLTAENRKVLYRYSGDDPNTEKVEPSNLIEVERRSGKVESYGYLDSVFEHYLTDIYDNDGVNIFEAEYYNVPEDSQGNLLDSYGRLKSTTNANGVPTDFSFSFDLGNGQKVRTTNLAGITIEEVVNGRGDVLRVVQLVHDSTNAAEKRYLVSVSRYNLRGLLIAQSKPFYVIGSENRLFQMPGEPDQHPSEWASLITYDDQGRVLTSTDATGAVVTNIYDDENGIFKTIDPFGVTSVRLTDPESGRLLETFTTDGPSNVRYNHIRYQYNEFGQLTRQVQVLSDGTQIVLSETGYNGEGFTVWTNSLNGPRQYFAYDANGQQTHSWQLISDVNDPVRITRVDVTAYDYDGRVGGNWVSNELGQRLMSQQFEIVGDTIFDETGFLALHAKLANHANDPSVTLISQSESIENERGLTVQTRSLSLDSEGNESWTISRTVYDSQGRVEYQTDSYIEGTPVDKITGSRTYYDSEGRVERTDQLIGLDIALVMVLGWGSTSVSSGGTILSYSETEFDGLGRPEISTHYSTTSSSSGLVTTTVRNLKGQTTETRSESWNADGTGKVIYISRTVYDAQDRVLLQTDSYRAGDTIYATKTLYDEAGRAYGSVRLKDVNVTIDANNQTTWNGSGTELYTTTSSYDLNRVVQTIGPDGQLTNYEYDSLGRQIATIGPAIVIAGETVRHRTETVFDERGRVVMQRSNIRHDLTGNGNHDDSDAQETSYEYDVRGNVVRTIYNDGSYAVVRYDDQGRKVAESTQVASDVELTWSAADNSYVDAGGQLVPTRTFEFDSQGRLIAVELPAVNDPANPGTLKRPRYEYAYDAQGQQTLLVDPNGHETRFEFNILGQQVSRTLPLGFGADGIQGTSDDGAAQPFSEYFVYDLRGRQTLHVSFEGVRTVSVYNNVTGRLVETHYFKDAASYNNGTGTPDEKRVYTYNDDGRISSVATYLRDVGTSTFTLTRSETTTYTEEGQIETIANDEGFIRYRYNPFGQQIEMAWRSAMFQPVDSHDFENVTAYSYDELGRLKTVTAVERNNALVDIDPSTPGVQPDITVYAYDLIGNLDTTKYSSGLIHDYDYDSLNRLEALYHWIDKADANGIFNGIRDAHEIMAEFDYELRADGKRVGVTEKFSTLVGETGVIPIATNEFIWQYDAAGRLISEVADSDSAFTDYTLTFAYDLAGNRLSQVKTSGSSTETTVYSFDANDRLLNETITSGSITKTVAYAYDKTQQTSKVTTEPDPVIGTPTVTTQTYEYNLQGRMSKSTTTHIGGPVVGGVGDSSTTYEYDSAGNRVASTTTKAGSLGGSTTTRTEYLTDSQNPTGYSQVLMETEFAVDANGQVGAPIKQVVYTIGHDQISQTNLSNWNPATESWNQKSEVWFGTDGHGSVRVLYDAAAAMVMAAGIQQIYHFDAYGNLLGFPSNGTPLTNYLYSGEAFDFNIGQQYLRARWYDPTNGRFNSLDPFYGNSSDPQSFHKYAYVHNDPIQGVDPTGMFISFGTVAAIQYNSQVLQQGLLIGSLLQYGFRPAMLIQQAGMQLMLDGAHELGGYLHTFGSLVAQRVLATISDARDWELKNVLISGGIAASAAVTLGFAFKWAAKRLAANAPAVAGELADIAKSSLFAQAKSLKQLGVDQAGRRAFFEGKIVPWKIQQASGKTVDGFAQLKDGKLTTQFFTINNPGQEHVFENVRAFKKYTDDSFELAGHLGVRKVELQGGSVYNDRVREFLIRQGFQPKSLPLPDGFGTGSQEVYFRIFEW